MTRYAIYAIPGAGPGAPEVATRLKSAVEAWYARDDVRDIAVDPVRYGFHATLKAPFRLADGVGERDLREAVGRFAVERRPVAIPAVEPHAIGRFRALVPGRTSAELEALATDVVQAFERLRAPLTDADVARRRPDLLTPRQRELLETYGYPYVLDEFRFHMTLTDPIPDERGAAVDEAIRAHFGDLLGVDVPLTALAVCVEPEPGARFRTLSIHPFGAEGRRPSPEAHD
ncbi:MAG: DUF1045 domain-containing protein [Microbacterium sp.]